MAAQMSYFLPSLVESTPFLHTSAPLCPTTLFTSRHMQTRTRTHTHTHAQYLPPPGDPSNEIPAWPSVLHLISDVGSANV